MPNTGTVDIGAVSSSLKRKRSHANSNQVAKTGPASVPKEGPDIQSDVIDSRNGSSSRLPKSPEDVSGNIDMASNENVVPLRTEDSQETSAQRLRDQHASEISFHAESHNQTSASDTDWMRSKTSRLLGLTDDDHGPPNRTSHMALDEGASLSLVETANDRPVLSDQSSSKQRDTLTEQRHTNSEPVAGNESALSATRLFIRNLPFSCTEENVKDLFEPVGRPHEVSYFQSILATIMPWSALGLLQ